MSRIIICLLALFSLPSLGFCQGVLQRERYAATHSPSLISGSGVVNWWNNSSSDPGGPTLDDDAGLGVLACLTATSPIWLPYLLFDDDFDRPGRFPPCPYARPEAGAIAVGPQYDRRSDEEPYDSPNNLKPWSLRISSDEGNSFAGLNRLSGEAFLDTENRLGVLLRGNWFVENLGGGRTDSTMLNDFNVTYRAAQNNWLQIYSGIGLREQLDRYDDLFGFNFICRADIYPLRPLHIEATMAIGSLDRAFLIEGHVSIGAVYRHFECFAGYDFLQIGSATLQGPFLGLRLWF
jgi:hypothetical protein